MKKVCSDLIIFSKKTVTTVTVKKKPYITTIYVARLQEKHPRQNQDSTKKSVTNRDI